MNSVSACWEVLGFPNITHPMGPTGNNSQANTDSKENKMSVTPNDHVVPDDVVAAAREFIRSEGDGCVVPISELLDELSDKFGDRFRASPDMHKLLDLIETLWEDPHIDQPQAGWIEFAWNEKGFDHDQVPATGLKAMLLRNAQIQSATNEGSKS
jgi:hypothetical protein